MQRSQRGEFNLMTLLALAGLLLVAVVALRYALGEAAQKKAAKAAVAVVPAASAVLPASAAAASGPRPAAHGLSFGLVPAAAGATAETVHLGCHGEPKVFDRPHRDSCNPYQGDTACNIVLPVLCVKASAVPAPEGMSADFYAGWVGGSLGATEPVMGAILESAQAASARCEQALGSGWRMAEFHDGQGGWGVQGLRGRGLGGYSRYWVHINDQPGNCWD